MRVPPTEAMESCTRYRTVSALVHPVATWQAGKRTMPSTSWSLPRFHVALWGLPRASEFTSVSCSLIARNLSSDAQKLSPTARLEDKQLDNWYKKMLMWCYSLYECEKSYFVVSEHGMQNVNGSGDAV
jgi:hypothetical protein